MSTVKTKATYPQGGTGLDTLGTAGQVQKVNEAGDGMEWGDASGGVVFGGDGSDGALSVVSGTTILDAENSSVLVKNYTSINIAAGATLTISNPGTNGTLLVLKSQGSVTIEGTIDLDGMGADQNNDGFGLVSTGNRGGQGKKQANGSSGGAGGSIFSTPGIYTVINGNGYNNFFVGCGAGGGECEAGALGAPYTPQVDGGRGGGAIIIECAGALDFDATGVITVDGEAGASAPSSTIGCGSGGGGGGSCGMALILYSTLTDNSGTVTASGGAGGNGGRGGTGGSPGTSQTGSGGGGGAGSIAGAGGAGAGGGAFSAAGNNGTAAAGAGAGGGAGSGAGGNNGNPGGTGAAGGASSSNHYKIIKYLG